jgi:hypothetical protein
VNITMPVAVVVAQWVALLTLAMLVLIFYRQLAALLATRSGERPDDAAHRSHLQIGAPVPSFSGEHIDDGREVAASWSAAAGTPSLLMFADPLCGTCEKGVEALNAVAGAGGLDEVRACIVTVEEPRLVRAVDAFRTSAVPILRVDKAFVVHTLKVTSTPLFYGVGKDGHLIATGVAVDPAGVRAILHHMSMADTVGTVTLLPVGEPAGSRVALEGAQGGDHVASVAEG